MKKLTSLMCAVSMAFPMMAVTPAVSAPVSVLVPVVEHSSLPSVVDVQYRRHRNHYRSSHNHYRPRHYRRHHRNGDVAAGILGGLAAGAIISGMANQSYRVPSSNSHINWCLNRYRSYDVRTDTFQPYSGPRRYCNSPYR